MKRREFFKKCGQGAVILGAGVLLTSLPQVAGAVNARAAGDIVIDKEQCIGCGSCQDVCPVEAISFNADSIATIDQGKCTACGACIDYCPVAAIQMEH